MKDINYIGVDIGGSHISCAVINGANGQFVSPVYAKDVDCDGTSKEIVETWKTVLLECLDKIEHTLGIGFAMPGPFDYQHGISLIEGVKKFDSLFAQNIKQLIHSFVYPQHLSISFVNDASAFALGEYYAGAAQGSKRTLIVTLGTGFGSTFLINGEIQQEAGNGVPEDGYLYHIPFGASIADDYFSTRWFVKRWKDKTRKEINGVREIADLAQQNNAIAKELFAEFANNMAAFITPWLQQFRADALIIGGNIAKSSSLFIEQLNTLLHQNGVTSVNIYACKLWENAPLIGAAMYAQKTGESKMSNKQEKLRKTDQFEAPSTTFPSPEGAYDIYPAFPIGTGKINEGYPALAHWIAGQKCVIIDGYVGVRWNNLVEQLNTCLLAKGKKAQWFHVEAAMKNESLIEQMIAPYLGKSNSIFGKITDKELIDWFDTEKLARIFPDEQEADIQIIIGCGAALAGWKGALIYVDLPKNELQFRMRAGQVTNLGMSHPGTEQAMYKQFYFVDWVVLNKHKAVLLPDIGLIVDAQHEEGCLFMEGSELRSGLNAMATNFFRVRPWFEPGAWGGNWMLKHIEGLNKDVPNLAWSFELMVLENGLMFESDSRLLEVSFDFLMYNNYREVLGDCAEQFKYDFPIRFDFLDTFDGGNLSVQCHPRPAYIREQFGMSFTQDETYYILDSQNDPCVYLGFHEDIDPNQFHEAILYSQNEAKEIDIEKYVQKLPARKHDLFLIPNGTIHASGKDNLVLEISSSPYIFTFKMYDWVRLDLNGKPRPINIEHGMKNLYFDRKGEHVQKKLISYPYVLEEKDDYKIEHLPTHAEHFYDVYRYSFANKINIETKGKCHVWMVVEGKSVIVETAAGMKQRFNYAETFVIPAATGTYTITNEGRKNVMMVKSFVK